MQVIQKSLPDTDIGPGVSAFSSPSVVEAAYKKIEEEIKVLEVAIRAWKERHNTLSITARLPPEILAKIFKCLVKIHPLPAYPTIRRLGILGWVNVTYVCAHWRRVALECPSLWTNITFIHHRWTEEMLLRSKMAPLTVVTDFLRHRPHLELVRTALGRIGQIRELTITEGDGYDPESLDQTLAGLVDPAPILEILSVSYANLNINQDDKIRMLPRSLFSGEAPRLRKLSLDNCPLAWDAPIFRSLTSFRLSNIVCKAKPSMSEIMATLSGMPNLQTLELCDVLPYGSAPDVALETGSEPIISLPHLTNLWIEADASASDFLLDHLSYPPTASVILHWTLRRGSQTGTDAPIHLPSIRGLCKAIGASQSARCLVAQFSPYDRYIKLTTYDLPGACLHPPTNAAVNITLQLLVPDHPGTALDQPWRTLLQSLWASIPLKNLESLHLFNPKSHNLAYIVTSLAATNLKRLRVAGGSGLNFLQTFFPDAPGRSKRRIPLKISSLRELAIEGWIFDEVTDNGTCAELLKACLRDRRKRRAAISELFLTNCRHIEDEYVEALGKVVKKVIWDGFENYSEDEEDEDSDELGCNCGDCG